MADIFKQRILGRLQGSTSGFAGAKKFADLAIKTNTENGKISSRGYERAIGILSPYLNSAKEMESIDAQRLVASYGSKLDKISTKEKNQNETVSSFKMQEMDSYFTSFDGDFGSFRRPTDLIGTTSEALDQLMLGVINAIDDKKTNDESTDALTGYLDDLQKRADSMRDLKNRYNNGELGEGQSLDGFGYYVDTNPLDGSIRRAALLPVGIAPEGLTGGFRRLDATTKVGGALLPVYAPATRDSYGEYKSKIGDATWSGTGDAALSAGNAVKSTHLFEQGGFDISDVNTFRTSKSGISNGSFGKGIIGKDTDGKPVESMFYRGNDGKLYNVDSATIDKFKKDPVLKSKIEGYVQQFSPTEMRGIAKEATTLPDERIGKESRITGAQIQATEAQSEADKLQNEGFFQKVWTGLKGTAGSLFSKEATQPTTSFFGRKNVPTKPEEIPTGGSTPDIIEGGKEFFRNQ